MARSGLSAHRCVGLREPSAVAPATACRFLTGSFTADRQRPAMIDLKRILCPIDFSAFSRRAFAYAVALAKWYEARITALHVFEPPVVPGFEPYPPPRSSYPPADRIKAEVERFVEPLTDSRVPVETAVEEGPVARTIVATAARLPAGLTVLGTHGRGGVAHLILGSVAEKVLRMSRSPVLTVPPAVGSAHAPVRFPHILCPLDFGPSSMKALEYALSVAQEADATLTLLHVLEPFAEEPPAVPFDVPEYRRLREERARELLRAALPADVADWCHPIELVAAGKPYREILRVALETAADLIVMGVIGRGAVDLMLFGSTTNHVVRQATCPVLTLRTPIGKS